MGKQLNPIMEEKYGCYEVISSEIHMVKNKNNNHHRGHYLVRCKCNREQLVRVDILKSGQATKCRYCSNKILYDKNIELGKLDKKGYSSGHQGVGDLTKTQIFRFKQSAKKRKIEWRKDIDAEYLWNLFESQKRKCALSGIDITLTKGKNIPLQTNNNNLDYSGWTASLDRIDSKKPYERGNLQWVHRNINIMKNSYSENYFIELCKKVVDHNKKI